MYKDVSIEQENEYPDNCGFEVKRTKKFNQVQTDDL